MSEDSEVDEEATDGAAFADTTVDNENVETEEETTEEVQEEVEEQESDVEDEGKEEQDEGLDKPVSEGEVVELEIEDLGSKGDGIARVEGFVVFVPGGEVGETYDVEITSVGRKFAFGEIQ
jgi:predicted RNA-binding protein with TRAM domain